MGFLFFNWTFDKSFQGQIGHSCTAPQQAECILNETEITLNDLRRVKDYALGVQNIFCLKSQIEGHRNGQLDSLATLAWIGQVQLGSLAVSFYGL